MAVELLRVVATTAPTGSGAPALAVSAGHGPGRGAWLHPDDRCLAAAIRRRAFSRALRIPGTPDPSAVVEYVTTFHPSAQQKKAAKEHEYTVKFRR